MTRYAALLRGVSPMNAKMPELQKAFEKVGFKDVRTVLSSGNVLFDAATAPERKLQTAVETALQKQLGRTFLTVVRSVDTLRRLLDADAYRDFRLKPGSKRVVTFLREPPKPAPTLPVELHGARILALQGCEAYTVYVRTPHGPVFMSLIEKTFGKDQTTRTWDTIAKLAK